MALAERKAGGGGEAEPSSDAGSTSLELDRSTSSTTSQGSSRHPASSQEPASQLPTEEETSHLPGEEVVHLPGDLEANHLPPQEATRHPAPEAPQHPPQEAMHPPVEEGAARHPPSHNNRSFGDRYETLGVIGNGEYGQVYQARDVETNDIVAVKRLVLEDDGCSDGVPAQVLREISLLHDFEHPNIVRLLAVQLIDLRTYHLIFEYVNEDLHKLLKAHRRQSQRLGFALVQKYSMDILQGVHACHIRRITHRDLKPQNILIHPRDGAKICDFGLARSFSVPDTPYTRDVITLWYRAPEILLGALRYGPEVDLWSAGCIVAEMATGYPIFPGDSEIGTLFQIFRLLGTPTEDFWPETEKPQHWKPTFPRWPSTDCRPILESRPELGEAGVDLVKGLLRLSPEARLKPRRAKTHAFFDGVRPPAADSRH